MDGQPGHVVWHADGLKLESVAQLPADLPVVDLGADWAMVRKIGRGVPTIDMRVDYHAVALPGDLMIKGKIVRMGSQFSTAEASIYSADGKLLASGRGTYYTAPPPPPKA